MKIRKIIGLTGRAGAGKDTAADALVLAFGYRKYAFADPLKRAAQIIFGLTDNQVHTSEKDSVDKFWGVSPRQILQIMGTEAMRGTFGQGIWIQCAERWMDQHPDDDVVISDVRFDNEAHFIRSVGGTVIHILRPTHDGLDGETGNHISEKGIEHMSGDLILINDESELSFMRQVADKVGSHV